MRGFALLLVLGTMLAANTPPAMAQPVRVAAPATETPYRQTFEADARARLRLWSQEVADFNKSAEAKGTNEDDAVSAELYTAWNDTKAEEKHLEVAGGDEWETARATFDQASSRFKDALVRAKSRLD